MPDTDLVVGATVDIRGAQVPADLASRLPRADRLSRAPRGAAGWRVQRARRRLLERTDEVRAAHRGQPRPHARGRRPRLDQLDGRPPVPLGDDGREIRPARCLRRRWRGRAQARPRGRGPGPTPVRDGSVISRLRARKCRTARRQARRRGRSGPAAAAQLRSGGGIAGTQPQLAGVRSWMTIVPAAQSPRRLPLRPTSIVPRLATQVTTGSSRPGHSRVMPTRARVKRVPEADRAAVVADHAQAHRGLAGGAAAQERSRSRPGSPAR